MKLTTAAVAALGLALTAVLGQQPALADLKIVSEVTMPQRPGVEGGSTRTVTQTRYFKADQFRQEMQDQVMLFDCGAAQVTFLKPEEKTYWVSDFQKMMDMASSNPMMARMKFDTTADVTPTDKTDTIAGYKAKEYLYTVTMKMSMEGMDSSKMPSMKMSGEEWVTEGIEFPTKCKQMSELVQQMRGMFGSGMKVFADKMAAIKGYPLRNKVTISMEGGPTGIPHTPMVTTTETKSVSSETLPESLFTVPADYKKIEAPMGPMGPMGGPRGRSGVGGATQ